MTGQKPCLRCLLEDMAADDSIRSLREYIAAYPGDRRVSEEVYLERLGRCRECDMLINGMCRECGCYVEIRALKPGQECAAPVKRWNRSDGY